MTKLATQWKTRSGYDTASPDLAGFSLLLESGDNLLLESGDELLLEDSVVTSKAATDWTSPSKNRTAWVDRDGSSTITTGVSEDLVTEADDERVTESGERRVTEDVSFARKNRTEWS